MAETAQDSYGTEEFEYKTNAISAPEKKPRAGFSDWQVVARNLGHRSLTRTLELLDPGDKLGTNNHAVIAERLKQLRLPVHSYTTPTIEDFLQSPETYFESLGSGDYFFASLIPGVHIAHANSRQEVFEFVRYAVQQHPELSLNKELYLSKNGEPVLSGHIIVESDDDLKNSVHAEFTNGNFNLFHRGFTTPEVSVRHSRSGQYQWVFRGSLDSSKTDWRDEQVFVCNGGVELTRPQIATKIFEAMQLIPHDEQYLLPGYYEVLIERTPSGGTKPIYIEAIPGSMS
jgi:hypothetical protein